MAYIFVAAAVLAVIPILVLFKVNMEKLKEDPGQRNKVQSHFMIGVAVSEVIPLILLVFGFMGTNQVDSMSELYIPGLIILLLMGFAAFFIFLQRKVDVNPETKDTINSFAAISAALVNAIPIVALVALFMMAP
ncbi:hypothetical protein [Virgibacillus salidurans]|uniref:hypothetical protein n=1 Tax=Virgibacillus salidurans TaxID=2831673 RepID=UPI001F27B8CD|nr:hypothetical protein [Virgibacillus sp. NKC19-16]